MREYLAEHLATDEKVKLGAYYTPPQLVSAVHTLIEPYVLSNRPVILDSAGGCGAFLLGQTVADFRIAERDDLAYKYLVEKLDSSRIFHTNSLENVSRDKFRIPQGAFLIVIGNPPYNDVTSAFRHGKKGEIICDPDIKDRDLGISFLKSYDKLNADIICVLHPLSYLIKEANFKRLRSFTANYSLIKGYVFSSSVFDGTGTGKFPIILSLYERNSTGMNYEYIRNFEFEVLETGLKFKLSNFPTSDGYIEKYPSLKHDNNLSDIGLRFYTFRDINSLKRNTTFLLNRHSNSIEVSLSNLYKYCYLDAFKLLFKPDDLWLYGNLSPIVDYSYVEANKGHFVAFSLEKNLVLRNLDEELKRKIREYYGINISFVTNSGDTENELEKYFTHLISKLASKEGERSNLVIIRKSRRGKTTDCQVPLF